jgi:hypothetical protein
MAYNDAVNNILTADNFYGNNPYSQFSGSPLPWPSSYAGTPTDAQGRPIQAQPGTTLNTPALAAAAPPPAAASGAPDYSTSNPAYANWLKGHPPGSQMTAGGQIPSGPNTMSATPTNVPATMMPGLYGQSQAAAAPQAASGAPGTQGLDSALSLLSNPGHVTTPGAQPMAPQGPSVLQSFLANNQGGQGAGNYNNAGFFQTLNKLQGATQPGGAP